LALALPIFAAGLKPLYSNGEIVDGQYIVVLNGSLTSEQVLLHIANAGVDFIIDTYEIFDFKGYSAKISQSALQKLRENDQVLYVEADQVVRIAAPCATQSNAEWNLDRICERDPNLDGFYEYTNTAGAGVDAYIIDTGILTTHVEFGTPANRRATWGISFVNEGVNTDVDCNGHGTHVAGTVAGSEYGVAKLANLIAVKVLSCAVSGTNAGVISGVDWTVSNSQKSSRRAVANMSLGGGFSQALNDAVTRAITPGRVTFALAAGNDNGNACNTSPASTPLAITVGSTAIQGGPNGVQTDVRSSFSNFGPCVDIFAPGSLIKSAWIGSNDATRVISGTSMASPHVCGAAVLFFGDNPNATPATAKTYLTTIGSRNKIVMNCPGTGTCSQTDNLFLYATCTK